MAIFARSDDLAGLVHHSVHGVHSLGIRYSERLGEAGIVASSALGATVTILHSPSRSTLSSRPS
jgi:hypothetical protein